MWHTGTTAIVCCGLIGSTDSIMSIMPNYQQFFSVLRSIGAELHEVDPDSKNGHQINPHEAENEGNDDVAKSVDT